MLRNAHETSSCCPSCYSRCNIVAHSRVHLHLTQQLTNTWQSYILYDMHKNAYTPKTSSKTSCSRTQQRGLLIQNDSFSNLQFSIFLFFFLYFCTSSQTSDIKTSPTVADSLWLSGLLSHQQKNLDCAPKWNRSFKFSDTTCL